MGDPAVRTLVSELRTLQVAGGVPVVAGGVEDHYEVMLFPPAPPHQIGFVQTVLGKRLPDDFVEFWHLTDGANLYVNESGLHGVGVTSTELMLDLHEEENALYGEEALARYAIFARVNGSGDFLAFQLDTGRVLDGVHAEQPQEWRPIADSFTSWLSTLIREHGRYFWLEALYDPGRTVK